MSKLTTTTKTKTTKPKAVKEEPVVENVVEPTVEATEVAEVTEVAESLEDSMKSRFERLVKSKQDLIAQLKLEVQELRKLQRDHEVAMKDALKKSKRKKSAPKDGVPRKPSGFASPVVVSDELYGFLAQFGVKKGEPTARTDVTRHITAYIKQHDLQNPEARREIQPDATLKKLFGEPVELRNPEDPTSQKVYTYLKLQRYLSPHFPKKQVSA
jgi:chromatin remodeling complex protein RSC6